MGKFLEGWLTIAQGLQGVSTLTVARADCNFEQSRAEGRLSCKSKQLDSLSLF